MAAKTINRLNARQVLTAQCDLNDGDSLKLVVDGKGNANWSFTFTSPTLGKQRAMGLGKCIRDTLANAGTSLIVARKKRDDARRLIAVGVDPIDENARKRDEARAAGQVRKVEALRERMTLRRFVRQYHEEAVEPTVSPRQAVACYCPFPPRWNTEVPVVPGVNRITVTQRAGTTVQTDEVLVMIQ